MTSSPRLSAWTYALPGVLYLLQGWLFRHYLTDDTFIYARFAQNLATHGELAFNPGEPVHAATSPLWAALGAVGAGLGADPFWTLKVLGGLSGAVAIALTARLACRLLPGSWPLWLTVVLATEPWFVRWSWSGMETPLGVVVVVGIVAAGVRGHPRWTWLAVLAGIGPLIRPELILLTALVGAAGLRARRGLAFFLALALPMAAWAAYAWTTFGHVFPATLDAKSTPFGLVGRRMVANVWVLAQLIGLALAVPTLVWLWHLRPWRLWRPALTTSVVEPMLWAWVLLLPAVYVVRDVQVVSRYLEVILPVLLILGSALAARSKWARPLMVAWCLQAAFGLTWTTARVVPSTRDFSRSIDAALGDISAWLREQTDPSDEVAIYDIGIVGYRSQRRILDLGGLIDPGINRLRNEMDDERIVREGHFFAVGDPRYLVHRAAQPDVLLSAPMGGRQLTPILHREVANLGLSRSEAVVYTLYRVSP